MDSSLDFGHLVSTFMSGTLFSLTDNVYTMKDPQQITVYGGEISYSADVDFFIKKGTNGIVIGKREFENYVFVNVLFSSGSTWIHYDEYARIIT